jgi:signal transduction histidine kinase
MIGMGRSGDPVSESAILGWARAIPQGFCRSAVLVGLTVVPGPVAAGVGFGGSLIALSWSAKLSSPLVLKVLAAVGELGVACLWLAVACWFMLLLISRPLSKATRSCAVRWLELPVEVTYRPAPTITRMATGYWWNGYEYQKSEREARRRGWILSRAKDPQLRRNGIWFLVAAVTVLPVAALPWLGLGAGVYLAVTPGSQGYAVAVLIASLAAGPFAWRVLGPVGRRFLGPPPKARLGQRVEELESIRADLTQTQAAELERIERGLHDGAQARLVALGMSMGAAEQLVDADPAAAKAILAQARASSVVALAELRLLVRGINPPVLVERGLVDAVRALALDAPVEVTVDSSVPSRPERPVESAVYFAVAELLANVAKHARATEVTVELGYGTRMLTATVTDDGCGGAAASAGSGLSALERRAAAFGGSLEVYSPAGGPTRITMVIPCVLS